MVRITLQMTELVIPPWQSLGRLVVLLYLGPDSLLPLVSAMAAILGFILMLWRFLRSQGRKAIRRVTGAQQEDFFLDDEADVSQENDIEPEVAAERYEWERREP